MEAPTENLVRGWARPEACQVRSAEDGGNTIFGHFAVFNRWTQIDSVYEGRFMERVAPGAFADTFKQRGLGIKILFEHGHDPQIGNKPIAEPKVFREDDTGAYYEGELFDASYVNDLKPALRSGQLGASFRFKVTGEDWVDRAKQSDYNPSGLPERTITGIDALEAGPVTFGAYDEATAGLRSTTDQFYGWMLDPLFAVRFAERVGPNIVEQVLAALPADGRNTPANVAADGASEVIPQSMRRQLAASLLLRGAS